MKEFTKDDAMDIIKQELNPLKSCPFCPEIVEAEHVYMDVGSKHKSWFINFCMGETNSYDTLELLAEDWNTRFE